MSFEVLDTRLASQKWDVVLIDSFGLGAPDLIVHADGRVFDPPRIEWLPSRSAWGVRVEVPAELVSDGTHVLLLIDRKSGETIASLPILAGSTLTDNESAELMRLRGEIEMLKRVVRSQFRSEASAFLQHLPKGSRVVHDE